MFVGFELYSTLKLRKAIAVEYIDRKIKIFKEEDKIVGIKSVPVSGARHPLRRLILTST
jgi:hypothetical protein